MSFEHYYDCNLHHEQWSDKFKELISEECSSLSIQDYNMEDELTRCPRCRLLHSFSCVSLLDWICNWSQLQRGLQESMNVDVPSHQPPTLVSCSLQVLDDAGFLDFNIQDPLSLEVALTRIGAVDQIPVQESSLQMSKIVSDSSSKTDTFHLGEDDSFYKKFLLTEALEQALTSLTPIQTLALDVLFDTHPSDWLSNSLVLNFEKAISNLNPLQSLAVAVKAEYIDKKSLPKFIDAEFIKRNIRS